MPSFSCEQNDSEERDTLIKHQADAQTSGLPIDNHEGSWENAELVISTHGVVKSATLLISPMAFNIENIGKKCFSPFFSEYVIFKFLHFFLKCCPKGEDLLGKKSWDTPLLITWKNRDEIFLC